MAASVETVSRGAIGRAATFMPRIDGFSSAALCRLRTYDLISLRRCRGVHCFPAHAHVHKAQHACLRQPSVSPGSSTETPAASAIAAAAASSSLAAFCSGGSYSGPASATGPRRQNSCSELDPSCHATGSVVTCPCLCLRRAPSPRWPSTTLSPRSSPEASRPPRLPVGHLLRAASTRAPASGLSWPGECGSTRKALRNLPPRFEPGPLRPHPPSTYARTRPPMDALRPPNTEYLPPFRPTSSIPTSDSMNRNTFRGRIFNGRRRVALEGT
jgi:hypothetical protein